MTNLLELLVAICGAEFVHNAYEIWGIRKKLKWLDLTEHGQDFGKWPFHINNRYKWVTLHSLMLIICTSVYFLILHILNFSDTTLIVIGIVVVLANYIFTTWFIDKYHRHIGKLIKSHRKSN